MSHFDRQIFEGRSGNSPRSSIADDCALYKLEPGELVLWFETAESFRMSLTKGRYSTDWHSRTWRKWPWWSCSRCARSTQWRKPLFQAVHGWDVQRQLESSPFVNHLSLDNLSYFDYNDLRNQKWSFVDSAKKCKMCFEASCATGLKRKCVCICFWAIVR